MQQLAGYARSTFWITGILQILMGLYIAIAMWGQISTPLGKALVVAAGLFVAAVGALSCLAARAWRRRQRFARLLVALSSLWNLAFFPFGTVAGAVGLYWCFAPKMRAEEPVADDFEHQPKPEDGTHAWVQMAVPVFSVAVWLAAFVAAGWWGRAHGLPEEAPINGLVLLILCEWVAVFCHEMGHTLAGGAVGMKLSSFKAGPFLAQRKGSKWEFQISLLSILFGTGGGITSMPLHLNQLRRRMAIEVAGGPLASLLTALAAFAVLLAMPGSAWEAWWMVPAMVAVISAGATVLNLVPFGFAAGYSDGALLMQLLRGGRFADLQESLKIMGSTMVTPTRPRDVDAHALANGVRAAAGGPEEGTLQMIQLICAVDRGELELAREHLEAGLRRIPEPGKALDVVCAAEMALYIAYLDGHAERAGAWLRATEQLAAARKTPLTEERDYWRATAAVREAEGLREQAEEAHQRVMELLAKTPNTGLYEYERDLQQAVRKGEWLRTPSSDEKTCPLPTTPS